MTAALAHTSRTQPIGREQRDGLDGAQGNAAAPEAGLPRFLSNGAVQAKLEVGAVDDPMERDADKFARAVERGDQALPRFLSSGHGIEARGAAKGAINELAVLPAEASVRRRTVGRDAPQPDSSAPLPRSDGDTASGGGARLVAPLRTRIEGSLGLNLGAVRGHTGAGAEQAAARLQARAFTHGRDI
ncbi:MAG: DUF4157 domain-containing protein [Proteobacteria bacterium]|nr:DUF4157 domain-containing protein [Pseudomonadota bacterium]MBS0553119.1 DUF4157 domain-containing protein [Pseudomonadota bacterium]